MMITRPAIRSQHVVQSEATRRRGYSRMALIAGALATHGHIPLPKPTPVRAACTGRHLARLTGRGDEHVERRHATGLLLDLLAADQQPRAHLVAATHLDQLLEYLPAGGSRGPGERGVDAVGVCWRRLMVVRTAGA